MSDDRALVQLTLVRFREFWREPEAVFWVFIFPILLAAGLGLAFRSRPEDVLRVAVERSAEAERTLEAIAREPGLAGSVYDRQAAEEALRTGRVVLVVAPQPGRGVLYRFDETNPESRLARLLVDGAIQRAAGRADPVPAAADVLREHGSRYIDFLIPGLLAMNLMGSGIWSVAFGIVDARRKKLLKRLVATPMSRAEYLLSFLLSRLILLLFEVLAIVGFAAVLFDVPVRGSLLSLAFLCVLASFSFSAIGLLIASRARTIEAASGLTNFVMLPMWVFSGVFFSSQRFPEAAQPLIKALPLTAAVDAMRAHMLQGAGLASMGLDIGILAAWMAFSFVIALRVFRWR